MIFVFVDKYINSSDRTYCSRRGFLIHENLVIFVNNFL
nr:MAG TPA: hypothetical protein [Caudoviricetes sp.]